MKLTQKEATRRAQDGEENEILHVSVGGRTIGWTDSDDEAVAMAEEAGGDSYDVFEWATGLRASV